MSRRNYILFAVFATFAFPMIACGKKGAPLPPLVKLPVAPADLAAERRGDSVDLSFTVPAANTDGTRPANVSSADVYAITVPVTVPPLTDVNLLKYGTKVGSVDVKAPRDPNLTADVDDPSDEVDAPEGSGLDQGALARLEEPLTSDMLTSVDVPRDKNAPGPPVETPQDGPLLGPPAAVPVRTYAAFGTSARGKKGPLSKRVTVPLVPPPPSPEQPTVVYNETTITVTWKSVEPALVPDEAPPPAQAPGLLPSRVIGRGAVTDEWMSVVLPILTARSTVTTRPAILYNVYDASMPNAAVRLTPKPLAVTTYADTRIVWGEKRCYIVVAAATFGATTIESEPPPPVCQTLVDTFAPEAPKGLNAIASEGAINLIWEPNAEKDLAGYIVLRGVEPAQTLQPVTKDPIVEPSFKDTVPAGVSYVYVVKAVDKAGNTSPASARVVETAR